MTLEALPPQERAFVSDVALDERDYGDMSGLDKDQARARWGETQIAIWRRSYSDGPPHGESLRDTAARVLPFYITCILPKVMSKRSVLVVSHGNTLRALIMALEGMSPAVVDDLEIATGQATIYDLSAEARVVGRRCIAASIVEARDRDE